MTVRETLLDSARDSIKITKESIHRHDERVEATEQAGFVETVGDKAIKAALKVRLGIVQRTEELLTPEEWSPDGK